MKMKKKIKSNTSDLFITIMRLFYEELKFNNIDISKSNISEGFSYIKKIYFNGKYIFNKAVITKLNENNEFETTIYTSRGKYIINYKLQEIDENDTFLIYTEEFISDKIFNNWNQKFMEFLLKSKIKKRLNKQLDVIEKNINSEIINY